MLQCLGMPGGTGLDKSLMVLGTPLLESYYVVFDRAHKQIGFAKSKGCHTHNTVRVTYEEGGGLPAQCAAGAQRWSGVVIALLAGAIGVLLGVALVLVFLCMRRRRTDHLEALDSALRLRLTNVEYDSSQSPVSTVGTTMN